MGAVINTTDALHNGCLHIVGAKNAGGTVIGPATVDALGPDGCIPFVDGAANNAGELHQWCWHGRQPEVPRILNTAALGASSKMKTSFAPPAAGCC